MCIRDRRCPVSRSKKFRKSQKSTRTDSLHIYGVPRPRRKVQKSSRAHFCQRSEKQMLLRRGSPSRFATYLRCLVTTSLRAEKLQTKKPSKFRGFFEKLFSASRSSDGDPRVPRRGPQARLPPFLQGDIRRPESLHIYSVSGYFAQRPLQKCRRSVLRTATASPKDRAVCFPFQKAPWVLAGAPGNVLQNLGGHEDCLLYTSPSPRDKRQYRMPSSA